MIPLGTLRQPTTGMLLLLLAVVVVVPVKRVAGIPMKSTIHRDTSECLYDFIEFGYVGARNNKTTPMLLQLMLLGKFVSLFRFRYSRFSLVSDIL
jgi:hypothetical protein